ncbi:hypothetical protein R1flu_013803 [Riccia fluitans]|uniref:Uncharacterized protein n=1 Tax=Riccia fluitans TaxID=41844 RepID=A0ABD1YEF7_9MARC
MEYYRGESSSSSSVHFETLHLPEEARFVRVKEQVELEFKICGKCWTMYGTAVEPRDCIVCADERNYGRRRVRRRWITHSQHREMELNITTKEVEKDLYCIAVHPRLQRCYLIVSPGYPQS